MRKLMHMFLFLILVTSALGYSGVGNAYGRNEPVDRVDIVHYFDDSLPARPSGNAKPSRNACYKADLWIATPVQYYINPVNSEGLPESQFVSTFDASASTWDVETATLLFQPSMLTTLHSGISDGKNVVDFGSLGSGTIAVTSIWYYRFSRQIVEWDMTFNTYYDWAFDGNAAKMDVQNIATHELGHTLGLADIYQGSCSSVTMYGYSTNGDVEKRTLASADIAGLEKTYGI